MPGWRRGARARSRTVASSSSRSDPRLERWLDRLLETPGLTSLREPAAARRVHLAGSLALLPHVRRFEGPIVDVGSGGGSPGIPLAAALPDRELALLEASRRKCRFLATIAADFPNVRVVCGRAEEQEPDSFGVAVARALAPPPVAIEWCLGLVRPGGAAILLVGPTADARAVSRAALRLGGAPAEEQRGLLVVRKVAPTPPGFPRRPGMARKRPLA